MSFGVSSSSLHKLREMAPPACFSSFYNYRKESLSWPTGLAFSTLLIKNALLAVKSPTREKNSAVDFASHQSKEIGSNGFWKTKMFCCCSLR